MSEGEQEVHVKHHVRIHIDQRPYESPNPTTGEALSTGSAVSRPASNSTGKSTATGRSTHREWPGNGPPERRRTFPQWSSPAQGIYDHRKRPEESGGTRRNYRLSQLSLSHSILCRRDRISCSPSSTNTARTAEPEGTLIEGCIGCRIKDGMVFNVTATDKS